MKKCPECGGSHETAKHSFKVVGELSDKGFPTHAKKYKEAHEKANKAEKKKYGQKQFKEIEKFDRKLHKHELSGKNLKSGKIEISKKVPAKYREEVAYHEKVENKKLRKKK